MPKIVDHDERRRELADVALALVAREGLAAVTTRAAAAESGWSTGVLNHYFASRGDLLLAALRRAGELQGRTYESILDGGADARARLTAVVESVLPLDDRRLAMTRVFLFFYAEGAAAEGARGEIEGFLARWRRVVRGVLEAGCREGTFPPDLDVDAATFALLSLSDGAAFEAVLDPVTMAVVRADGFAARCVAAALSAGATG